MSIQSTIIKEISVKNNREETTKSKGVRRHAASGGKYGTVNFNVQQNAPKFFSQGRGVLLRKDTGDRIRRAGRTWVSMSIIDLDQVVAASIPPMSPPPPDLIPMPTL
jgi:hypothetical protein